MVALDYARSPRKSFDGVQDLLFIYLNNINMFL